MDHPDLPNPQKASARRRLIRGALSAPALMTVCAGSAFAAASNLRCLRNAAGATTPPAAWGATGPDTFLRVRLYKVTINTVTPCTTSLSPPAVEKDKKTRGSTPAPSADPACTTIDKFYIKGSDLGLYKREIGMPTDLQYLEISPTTYTTIGAPVLPPTPAIPGGPGGGSEGYVDRWAAVRFNASGVVVGVGDGSPGGMVGGSCWASASPFLPI